MVTKHHCFLLRLHLDHIDGVQTTSQVIVAEIGDDMTRFPTSAHLISWAGLCPRNGESAGKRRSNRIRERDLSQGPPRPGGLVRYSQKGLLPRTQYFRLKSLRGPKKAIVAVAASILTAAYHMLRDGVEYHDLEARHFDQLSKGRTLNTLVKRIEKLGYRVSLEPAA